MYYDGVGLEEGRYENITETECIGSCTRDSFSDWCPSEVGG